MRGGLGRPPSKRRYAQRDMEPPETGPRALVAIIGMLGFLLSEDGVLYVRVMSGSAIAEGT